MPKYVMPPRQKMINLIYIVLIAMLGINVSQDALEGYDLFSKDFQPQIAFLQTYNVNLGANIAKDKPELETITQQVREKTETIQQELNQLKVKIAQTADRSNYQNGKLLNRDNMDATPNVMLNFGQAKILRTNIETYKKQMNLFVGNGEQLNLLGSYLDTNPQRGNSSWENETFAHLTANAGIAILNKLEEEALTYEKEVLQALINQKDELPESQPEIPLIDENQIYINGAPVDVLANGTIHTPLVQVSSESASILYKGYENRLNLVSIGVAGHDLKLSMKGGQIIERNGQYWAIPDKTAQSAGITASKGNEVLARYDYLVKELPDPMPYVVYNEQGKQQLYKGNVPLSKSKVQAMTELVASASEGPQIAYRIQSFETVFIKSGSDKVITLKNQGNKFSEEQRRLINQLQPGDKFYITSITVSGGAKNNEQIASINIVLI
ncbi:GldM family protein [Bacteroides sp.]|uniref:type IX secretion system motor protein PorM/GldM n=1 Tax=Bacteroides sp. TaxID=29523 RepID=UPI00261395CC|nr:GldM family protein [Bacteroides sp.]